MRLSENQLQQVYKWCRVPSNRALIKDFCRYKACRYILSQALSMPLDHIWVKQETNTLDHRFRRCEDQYFKLAQARDTLKRTEPNLTEQQIEDILRDKFSYYDSIIGVHDQPEFQFKKKIRLPASAERIKENQGIQETSATVRRNPARSKRMLSTRAPVVIPAGAPLPSNQLQPSTSSSRYYHRTHAQPCTAPSSSSLSSSSSSSFLSSSSSTGETSTTAATIATSPVSTSIPHDDKDKITMLRLQARLAKHAARKAKYEATKAKYKYLAKHSTSTSTPLL
ncbi:hypothetical protein BCR43DRAFT_499091 [Syncephalastrum racemosum]|uniref:Uncharacterized protein n=1 Tax=Syncephalastrum racemosum TaxID=13706 RepID=A0A1X2H1Y8_SYNRA|nr:hypothetical protein BCR43DRAFT_499091 [Syncephalastrum racemosum]